MTAHVEEGAGHVVGLVVVVHGLPQSHLIEVSSVEAMEMLLARQETPGDELYESPMEFFRRIEWPGGIEYEPGYSPTLPPGTTLYNRACDGCGKSCWRDKLYSNVHRVHCADCSAKASEI
jgi:hypothetical protein